MPKPQQPLFSYCLAIGGREFLIRVTPSGVMDWDDYQDRRECGNPTASMVAQDEFTVSLQLAPEMLNRFQHASAKFDGGEWGIEDESELDRELTPLFWNQINSRLPHPIQAPVP